MPTKLPSVSTFTAPNVVAPVDPERNPTQAVAYWLRRDIARGVFEPLERLKVEHLTKFYDIGHSPIREAIVLLVDSGLVIHEHQKGYRAAPVSLEDYQDLLTVYQRIYKMMLGMAMERGDDAWEEQVVIQLHRSLKIPKVVDGALEPQAREMWQRSYGDLHQTLLSGCRSPLLMKIYKDIGARLERYINLFADLETDRYYDHHADHRLIVDAIIARDADRTQALIERYFAVAEPIRKSIITALKAMEATPSKAEARDVETAPRPAKSSKTPAARRSARAS